jgi:hypothetical protein
MKEFNEIETFDFFNLNNLPTNVSTGTRKRVQEYINGQFNNFGKW